MALILLAGLCGLLAALGVVSALREADSVTGDGEALSLVVLLIAPPMVIVGGVGVVLCVVGFIVLSELQSQTAAQGPPRQQVPQVDPNGWPSGPPTSSTEDRRMGRGDADPELHPG